MQATCEPFSPFIFYRNFFHLQNSIYKATIVRCMYMQLAYSFLIRDSMIEKHQLRQQYFNFYFATSNSTLNSVV
uniref:Uncharacterized protein n=1 Tax=Arundo donax TaxID=35708 RepID=A0A0A9A8D0_ARUDO